MLLGVSGNKAESSAQRWEFGAEMEQGLRITGRGIKGSIWLAVMLESSICLAASCCFDHVPLRVHCLDMAAFLIQTPHPVLPSALFSFALDSPLAAMLPFSAVLDVTPQIHLGCWLSRCSHLDVFHKTSLSLKANALECRKKRSSRQLCDSKSVFYVVLLTCCLGLPSPVTLYLVTYF